LQAASQNDSRIKIVFREQNGHISEASNSALALVDAEFVALMDHDDLLTPDALYWVAKAIKQNPDVQLIYSDEDKMDLQGQRYAPYFKPDWNPELFLSHNFICHLGVYKTKSVRSIGGFDSSFDGAQDYDLALRYVDKLSAEQIVHIPRILYHWRAVEGSTAHGVHEKPYAEEKIAKAVVSALKHKQRPAEVINHEKLPGTLRVRYLLPDKLPLVSIVIPTRNGFNLLHRCVESIFSKTNYANYELIIIDNGSDDFITLRYLQRLQHDNRVTVIRDESPFNYSALNNKAVLQAKGEIIALLNNDLEGINDDWLDEMVSFAQHSEIGAVGAKLYYPNDTIQHAGVIVGLGGVAGHSHKHFPRDNPGYCGRLLLTQNLTAVTAACLVLRKEVYNAVGGLDEKNLSVAFNDVDFCLRIREQGFLNVWTPYAEMYHYESATRGYEDTPEKQARFTQEVDYMQQRWGESLLIDPAYNPNLTVEREDFSFAWPPRI
jgi:GT2 family glycosyltransferase